MDSKEARDNSFIILRSKIYFSIVCSTKSYLDEKNYGRIEYHFIRDQVILGIIEVKLCCYGFIIALNYISFMKFQEDLGVSSFASRGSVEI